MLPTDYDARKAFPLLTVLAAYFPDAIEALVELAKQGNIQHKVDLEKATNPYKLSSDQVTWDRSKSDDHMNTLMRHTWDHERAKRGVGDVRDTDGHLHIVKALWRAAAEAQLAIEELRAVVPAGTMPRIIKAEPDRYAHKLIPPFVIGAPGAIHSPGSLKPVTGCDCSTCDKLRRTALGV